MRVYIDKENASHIATARESEKYEMGMRLLKRNDLFFTFSKEDIFANDKLSRWYKNFNTGFKGEIKFIDSIFPDRPVKANFTKNCTFDQLTAIYLISDEKASTLAKLGNILIADNHNDLDIVTSLCTDEDGELTRSVRVKGIKEWKDLLLGNIPLTDIIITDPYIFSDYDLLPNNLYSLLKELTKRLKDSQSKINIVILTLPELTLPNGRRVKPNFDKILSDIKNEVKKIIGATPNVTFILSREKDKHDRMIITNYISYDSGDSFNFFDSRQRIITKGDTWHINSHMKLENLHNSQELLKDVQEIINRVSRLNNSNLIIGDKTSFFLNFSSLCK